MPSAKTKVTDIDALISDALEKSRSSIKYNKIKLFDREWRVTTQPNVYAALASSFGEIEALVNMIPDLVHPDERGEFKTALYQMDGLDAEILMTIMNHLVEVGSEHPTKSPSGSSRASKKTSAAGPRSAAS